MLTFINQIFVFVPDKSNQFYLDIGLHCNYNVFTQNVNDALGNA